jgi:predicted AAA+ superfamily ATPase
MATSLTGRYVQIAVYPFSFEEFLRYQGLSFSDQLTLSPNNGRLLENLVFVELLRRNYKPELDLFYYKTRNDREIDFVCRKGHRVEQLIQVSYDITNPRTLKRELDALIEAAVELTCENLLLITWDKEEVIKKNELEIKLVPASKWLYTISE